jgi:hypothetical protein
MTTFSELAAIAAVGVGQRTRLPPAPERLTPFLPRGGEPEATPTEHAEPVSPDRSADDHGPGEPTDRQPVPAGPALAVDLLDRAAALSVVRAGTVPSPGARVVAAAPLDPRPPAPPAFVSALRQVRAETSPLRHADHRVKVQVEALGWLDRAGLRLPHDLIVEFLSETTTAVRTAAMPVLGLRGRWLVSLPGAPGAPPHPTDAHPWEYGVLDQQCAFLTGMRHRDPGAGRALVEERWTSAPGNARARYTRIIAGTATPGDEQFLDKALADRAADVREAAADGLLRLPDSAYVRRMEERVRRCVTWSDDKTLRIDPPPSDGTDLRPKLGGQERVTRMVRAVPPHRWPGLTGRTAIALLQAVQPEPAWDLASGLADSAIRWRDAALATELVAAGHVEAELVMLVPAADLGAALGTLVPAALKNGTDGHHVFESLPCPWPQPFAMSVAGWLADPPKATAQRLPASAWASLAFGIPPAVAGDWADWVRSQTAAAQSRVTSTDRAATIAASRILTMRSTLWQALQPAPTPPAAPTTDPTRSD